MNDIVPSCIEDSTVQIGIERGLRRLEAHGTGTLINVGEYFFLVTAAHVLSTAYNGNHGLIAIARDYVQILGPGAVATKKAFDVGLIHLADLSVEQLRETKKFLNLHDVSIKTNLENAIFCLYGYPAATSKPVDLKAPDGPFESTATQLITHEYDGTTDGLPNYNPDIHLLLRAQNVADSEGNQSMNARTSHKVPFLQGLPGISGCSVWKIAEKGNRKGAWGEVEPRLIAVETAVYRATSTIKSTRWTCVVGLIQGMFPDLKPVIALHEQRFIS